jgi:CRP-like cAMP-binding protein
MTSASTFSTPSLLDRLLADDRNRLLPALQLVTLEPDQLLYQAGQAVTSVYFPVTAQIEEVLPPSGAEEQVLRRIDAQAMAGSCVLGDAVSTRMARVCSPGQAYRMGYADFVRALNELRPFRDLVMQDAAAAVMACGRP